MSDAVQEFFTRLREDRELAKEYKATVHGAMEAAVGSAILEVAARNGSTFSADELRDYVDQQSSELSDDQLATVTGGGSWWADYFRSPWFAAPIITGAIVVPLAYGDGGDDAS